MNIHNHKTSRFSALYYPFSRCLSLTDLKRAILVFDELLFVDPLSKEITTHFGQHIIPATMAARTESESKWHNVTDIYERLEKHNLVRLVTPTDHLKDYQKVLTYSLLRDFSSNRYGGLERLIGSNEKVDLGWGDYSRLPVHPLVNWKLHISRIPQSLVELKDEDDLLMDCIVQISDDNVTEDDRIKQLKTLKTTIRIIEGALQRSQNDEVILPMQISYLLVLNQALLLCEELQAFPVTDDLLAYKGLLTKFSSIYESSENYIRSVFPQPTAPDLHRIQFFTLSVVSQLVPDQALARLDIDQIIAFRKDNAENLGRFQEKMVEMASEITTKPWNSDFRDQVNRLIEGKILPEVRAIDGELKESYRKLFGSAISELGSEFAKAVALSLPTMTMATLLGLSTGQVVVLGTASILSGLGIVLPEVVKFMQEKRALEKSGLTFLLKFREDTLDYGDSIRVRHKF